MAASGPNPVLAPIRRWVLYSRTNLAVTVVGVVAVLFGLGAVFGQPPAAKSAAPAAAAAKLGSSTVGQEATYRLVEVGQTDVAGKAEAQTRSSAPATAMAYAHAFVDTNATDQAWTHTLGLYTADTPTASFASVRPQAPVLITGPTVSTLTDYQGGTRGALVTIPTQAGNMQVTLSVENDGSGGRWVVDSPLPTLDLSKVANLSQDATSIPAPAATADTAAPPIDQPTTPSTPAPAPAPVAAGSTPAPASAVSPGPAPVPVPGPIPIPNLNTPIPGQL